MEIILINISQARPKSLGFKLIKMDGKLIVKSVDKDGLAYDSGLRSGDIIQSVNDELVDVTKSGRIDKIMKMKGDINFVIQRSTCTSDHFNNSSISGTDLTKSTSLEKLSTSSSSFDFKGSKKILDSNYVPEEQIDNFLEPAPADGPLQVIRKPAYNTTQRKISCIDSPKINVKLANKATIVAKEPSFTIKKKVNETLNDVIVAATTLSQKSRFFVSTDLQTEVSEDADSPSSGIVNDENSGKGSRKISIDSPSFSLQLCASPNQSINISLLEVSIKMLSFKDKEFRKPSWKVYTIRDDSLGVFFECHDIPSESTTCNSMAVDPNYSGLSKYMDLWSSNNTMSKFFLPFGEEPFCKKIGISIFEDNVHILFTEHFVNFIIMTAKMSEDKLSILSSLLRTKLEIPEQKQVEAKKKLRKISVEDSKLKKKSRKEVAELIETPMLSDLHQCSLVESVPLVAIICVRLIEKFGIGIEGIYRKPGSQIDIKKLKDVVTNMDPGEWSKCDEWDHIHAVASLLKNVLGPYHLIDKDTTKTFAMINMDSFTDVQLITEMDNHLRRRFCESDFKPVGIESWPIYEIQCRFETFKYLLNHLHQITQNSDINRMSAETLATCFLPTLIDFNYDIGETGVSYQDSKKYMADKNLSNVVAFWIRNIDRIPLLLEESNEKLSLNKISKISDNEYNGKYEDLPTSAVEPTEDIRADVRQIIDYCTSKAISPKSEHKKILCMEEVDSCNQVNANDRNVQRTDLSYQIERKKIGKVPSMSKEFPLTAMRLSGYVENVPLVVYVCVKVIEQFGLKIPDLYSTSCHRQHNIEFLGETEPIHWLEESTLGLWSNLYHVSDLLKRVLSRFPIINKDIWKDLSSKFSETLVKDILGDILISTVYHFRSDKNPRLNTKTLEKLEDSMEKWSRVIAYATLRFVLKHLQTTSAYMSSYLLASSFERHLIENTESDIDASMVKKRVQILEMFINHFDWIFEWVDRPLNDISIATMTDSVEVYLNSYSRKDPLPMLENHIMANYTIDFEDIRLILSKHIANSRLSVKDFINCRRNSESTQNDFCENSKTFKHLERNNAFYKDDSNENRTHDSK